MGREIRRVPANWEHPTQECPHSPYSGGCGQAKINGGKCFIPLYDRDHDTAAREWLDNAIAWDNGTHEDLIADPSLKERNPYFWQWDGDPPDPETHRPAFDTTADWYQVYETVSEGTPVTPPFATKEELVNYLVEHGDFWDIRRGDGGWSRAAAERFVADEWSPSMIIKTTPDSITINEPRDGFPE